MRTRTKCNDLQFFETNYGSCNRNKRDDHISYFISSSNRISWYICLYSSQVKVIRKIKDSAICIASSIDKVVSSLLCSSCIHDWSIEELGDQCLRCLRTKVTEIHTKSIAALSLSFLYCLYSIEFVFNYD